MDKFDNSMFKNLTCGVTFDKSKLKRKSTKETENKETIESSVEFKFKEDEESFIGKKKKYSEAFLRSKNSEIINKLRKAYNINVKGCDDKVKPVESFQELFDSFALDEQLKRNLKDFNFNSPSPVQMQVLPIFLREKSIKVVAPTGSGKTICYALSLIQILCDKIKALPEKSDKVQAIVIVPTRELAFQILSTSAKLCNNTAVRAHIIKNTNDNYMKNFHKKKSNILITTPLKLVHFIKSGEIEMQYVEWIVIDEVDKLFEESNHGFKDDIDLILASYDNPNRKFALFSATTTKEMTPFVHKNLKDFVTINISPNIPASSVQQELLYVGTESAKVMTLRNLLNQGVLPPILIFVQSKMRAKQLHSELLYDEAHIEVIHSDRSQTEREDVYKKFREGKIWVLICTELMSRGIDFRDVNMVVNFDLPTSTYSYIHRIGRCGRANRTGKAITFYTADDKKGILRDIAELAKKSGSHVEEFLLQLRKSKKKERVALLKKAPKRKNIVTSIETGKKSEKSMEEKLKNEKIKL